MSRPAALVFLTILSICVTPPANGAHAQSLGLWGGWNDHMDGWQDAPARPRRELPSTVAPARAAPFGYDSDGVAFPAIMDGGARPVIAPRAPPIVAFPNSEPAGTILIDTGARRLYYTLGSSSAFEYPISVGREGFTWTGEEKISRVATWPDWHPPQEMRQRDPRLPEKMFGGIRNPLGSKALFLGSTLYRIHGTNDPKTIGLAASSGCFRMMNHHVEHLATLVSVGTVVKVLDQVAPVEASADLPWLTERSALGMGPEAGNTE